MGLHTHVICLYGQLGLANFCIIAFMQSNAKQRCRGVPCDGCALLLCLKAFLKIAQLAANCHIDGKCYMHGSMTVGLALTNNTLAFADAQ